MDQQTPKNGVEYPKTRRENTEDTYFGHAIADPYRWLEDDRSQETADWVKLQNAVTQSYLEDIPFRSTIKDCVASKFTSDFVVSVQPVGDKLYYSKQSADFPQAKIYCESSDGEVSLFLDVNEFSDDGSTSLQQMKFSKSRALVACALSDGGSDWMRVVVMSAETMSVVDEAVTNVKFSSIEWFGDEGFYYSTYNDVSGSRLSAKTDHHKVYFHTIGQPLSDDALVFGAEDEGKYRYVSVSVSTDQKWIVLYGANTTATNEAWIRPTAQSYGQWQAVSADSNSRVWVLDVIDDVLYIQTDRNAPKGQILKTSVESPSVVNANVLIPEQPGVLAQAIVLKAGIMAIYEEHVVSSLWRYSLNGETKQQIEVPADGSVTLFYANADDEKLYLACAGLATPRAFHCLALTDNQVSLKFPSSLPFDSERFETKQVFFESKDGTRVPMFIAHRKGLELNGDLPTLLYGYGGFNVSVPPVISAISAAWLEMGGVYATANIRGGGEYGQAWHIAGTKMQKQNVFDDFIAAAEFLIEERYCSSETLAIKGGSNGGLLVGACMTQRPELFRVALPAVGVLDMLRYHQFTSGAGWAFDYGTAQDNEDMFQYLKNYSPLHNVNAGTVYPSTLISTGDHDDRVVPAHSFKFAAELQNSASSDTPMLLNISIKSGHGAGKSFNSVIEETTDAFAFTLYEMNKQPNVENN